MYVFTYLRGRSSRGVVEQFEAQGPVAVVSPCRGDTGPEISAYLGVVIAQKGERKMRAKVRGVGLGATPLCFGCPFLAGRRGPQIPLANFLRLRWKAAS